MGVRSKLGIGALVLIAGTALLLRGLTATGSDGSSLSTGLIQQEVAGLRLLSPGELTLIPGAAGADEDTTIVEHDVYQATGLGLIMSLTRITYVEGTAPFVDDAVTRTVAAVQRRVTRPDGSDEFTHLATRVGVSGTLRDSGSRHVRRAGRRSPTLDRGALPPTGRRPLADPDRRNR